METALYFVRHAESVYAEGKERTRGLTEKGTEDAQQIRDILKYEDIHYMVSSSYERAIATIRPLAAERNMEIRLEENLRERQIGDFAPLSFKDAKYRVYEHFQYAFPGGESSAAAQERAVKVLLELLRERQGQRIVVGTHGDIMTLMLNYFDKAYGYPFWETTTMPDVYKLCFNSLQLKHVTRLWLEQHSAEMS